MAAVAETKEKVAALGDKYKYGFITDIEMERAPKWPHRRHGAFHFSQEGRAGMDAGMAAFRLSPLA